MHILEKYITALNNLDADSLAQCFSVGAIFEDKAAPTVWRYEGRENIREIFTKALNRQPGEMIATIYSLEGNTMDYVCISYKGTPKEIISRCTGTALIKNGLIDEYYVRKCEKEYNQNDGKY